MDYYYSFNRYLKDTHQTTHRIWRIPLSTGFPCPNRHDGKTGCSFCTEISYKPRYLRDTNLPIADQLQLGMEKFGKIYKTDFFYGYFQDNTSTFGPIDELVAQYKTALEHPKVLGLMISTRPDYVTEKILQAIEELANQYSHKDIWIELGLQTTYDKTLERINRGHNYQQFCDAVSLIKRITNFKVGVHTILGLPGETTKMMESGYIRLCSENQIDGIKFRILEIFPDTDMINDYQDHPEDFYLFSLEEYVDLVCNILEQMSPEIVVMRFANWRSLKNLKDHKKNSKEDIIHSINLEFKRRHTYQGYFYQEKNK
ncbi:MAG: TIGR01212 family radical SAM protein [Spirochaetes bacterium]|nr:TIGR01212 family radical SAM protein [Spirochaetota bacterium]